MGVSKNNGAPKSFNFHKVFHYKPSILGYPYFLKHPYRSQKWQGFAAGDTFDHRFQLQVHRPSRRGCQSAMEAATWKHDKKKDPGWWFQILFMFIPIWGNDPIWLIFFQMGWNHQIANFRPCFLLKGTRKSLHGNQKKSTPTIPRSPQRPYYELSVSGWKWS